MELFPAMPLDEWAATKETFHRFAQIVGKIRMGDSNRRNHWWHVPFHLTGRGLTTRPMGGLGEMPVFCIDFDLVRHRLVVDLLDGRSAEFSLVGKSVAGFYATLMETLSGFGIRPDIWAVPYDLGDETPFAEDTDHAAYDPILINRYWRILAQVAQVLDRFAQNYAGKISPVHHFWHTMDIAVTRFTGRVVGASPEADPVTREAYSWEVISAGFWFGDQERPWPAFYSYTAPEPEGLDKEPLRPEQAQWLPARGSHLAVLRYDDVRASERPVATVLDFLQSAYQAGAKLTGCDRDTFDCPGGVTDPYTRTPAPREGRAL
ncbi:hypothetical protein HII36_24715 [Nonomuraea sp. NN258]|uniref:DUF5996 family protein n=1 Tax=Nonomuraea antri TaxID=2730852 RepID=UPI00156A3FC4|nr:DUF5996 family protein [Nonomuraea antri]NRQ35000.1 hypothetical protein [Nonomuraea antri]